MFLPWPWLIIVFIQQLWWLSAFQLCLCEYSILHDGQNNPLYLPLDRIKFQNQLRETRLFLIIPHDDKTLCYSVCVWVGGWRYQILLKLILLPIDAEMKMGIISQSHQLSFFSIFFWWCVTAIHWLEYRVLLCVNWCYMWVQRVMNLQKQGVYLACVEVLLVR